MQNCRKLGPMRILLSLVVSLLIAQSSVAQHDLDHHAGGHTEYCKIYSTHDFGSALSSTSIGLSFAITTDHCSFPQVASLSLDSSALGFLSRAPPQRFN